MPLFETMLSELYLFYMKESLQGNDLQLWPHAFVLQVVEREIYIPCGKAINDSQ